MLRHLDAHQQPTVRAALYAEFFRTGDAARNEVLRHGREVVVDHLPLRLQPGFVPLRTEFTSTADVRDHVHAAFLEPELAGIRIVAGSE